ncbi:MAG: diguanylate cyclase [Acidobacteria bacterium]|nr:diguanylate cyclase [Acidobacteriota bacterium]
MGWEELQSRLRQLERRDWWLWWASVVIMFLLTAAVVALALPTLLNLNARVEDTLFDLNITLGVRGLIGLVLLFNTYSIYQQILIKRLRRGLAEEIAALAKAELRAEELHRLAMRDPLTGLYNRRFVEHHMSVEFARAERFNISLTLLILDLNNFKEINDRHGHPAGDVVLCEFANRLNKACRGSDLAARIGGDEFMLLLPECLPVQVPIVLSRLSGMEVQLGEIKIPVTFSVGWAEHQAGEKPRDLLERADQDLYAEKRTGKVEEGIRQAQKMQTMGQLTSGVAHDLSNLLMVIKSYSELALDEQGL